MEISLGFVAKGYRSREEQEAQKLKSALFEARKKEESVLRVCNRYGLQRKASAEDLLERVFMDSDSENEPMDPWDDGDAEVNPDNSPQAAGGPEVASLAAASALSGDSNHVADIAVQNSALEGNETTQDEDETTQDSDADGEDTTAGVCNRHTCMHAIDISQSAKDDTRWTRRNDANPPPTFGSTPGLVTPPPDNVDIRYFVDLFFNNEVINLLVRETNRYADQYKAAHNVRQHSLVSGWCPVTRVEMQSFLGLYFLKELGKKQQLQQYWSTDPLISTPIFSTVMCRKRFQAIMALLHFTNNMAADKADKLYKVRPLIDVLVKNFRTVYKPQKQISIDEELVLFKSTVASSPAMFPASTQDLG